MWRGTVFGEGREEGTVAARVWELKQRCGGGGGGGGVAGRINIAGPAVRIMCTTLTCVFLLPPLTSYTCIKTMNFISVTNIQFTFLSLPSISASIAYQISNIFKIFPFIVIIDQSLFRHLFHHYHNYKCHADVFPISSSASKSCDPTMAAWNLRYHPRSLTQPRPPQLASPPRPTSTSLFFTLSLIISFVSSLYHHFSSFFTTIFYMSVLGISVFSPTFSSTIQSRWYSCRESDGLRLSFL